MLKSFFNKVAGLKACNVTIKRPQHRCFPVKFVKFLKISFLKNTSTSLKTGSLLCIVLCN